MSIGFHIDTQPRMARPSWARSTAASSLVPITRDAVVKAASAASPITRLIRPSRSTRPNWRSACDSRYSKWWCNPSTTACS